MNVCKWDTTKRIVCTSKKYPPILHSCEGCIINSIFTALITVIRNIRDAKISLRKAHGIYNALDATLNNIQCLKILLTENYLEPEIQESVKKLDDTQKDIKKYVM